MTAVTHGVAVDPDRPHPAAAPSPGRAPAGALGPAAVLAMQRTAGNAAVTRVLARVPAHPLDLQIRAAHALQGQEDAAFTRDKVSYQLTRGWADNRQGLLGMERVIDAMIAGGRVKPGFRAIGTVAQTDVMKTRQQMLNLVATRGVRAGLGYAEQLATTPERSLQLQLVRKDIKIVQEQFGDRVRTNVHALLDHSQERIEAVLKAYGLMTAYASPLVDKVAVSRGELDSAVDEWIDRARSHDSHSAPKASGARGDLARLTDQVRGLQKVVVDLQFDYVKRFDEAPLDEDERRRHDRLRYRANKTPLPHIPDLPPEAKELERRINAARLKLTTAWIAAERDHPILAAHRGRVGRHLEWVDLGGYTEPVAFGDTTDDKVRMRIAVAHHMQRAAASPATHERAAVREAVRKLANIQRARLAIGQRLLSPLKLAPVVRFTEKQLLIAPGSAWAAAVRELVEPEKSVLGKGLEFVEDLFQFALIVVSALPNPAAPAAALWEVGRNAFVAIEDYVKQDLQESLSDTDLDLARSLSDKVPSLTGFVLALINTGLALAQLKATFELAARARRKALHGLPDGWDELDRLGKLHNVPSLADDVARAEGVAGKSGGKSALEEELERAAKARKGPTSGAGHADDLPGGSRPHAEPEPGTPMRETAGKSQRRPKGRVPREYHASEADLRQGLKRGFERIRKLAAEEKGPPKIDELLRWLDRHDPQFAFQVRHYYQAIKDPKFLEEQMVFLWNSARTSKPRRTVAQELEHLMARGEKVTEFRNTPGIGGAAGTEEFRQAIAKQGPLKDLSFATDPHSAHVHMFHEFLGDRLWNRVGAGREFRLKLANYRKGPGKTIFPGQPDQWEKPFWSRLWDALFDADRRGFHRSEDLGDILQTHLDLPEA